MANGKAQTQKTNSDVILRLQKDQKKIFGNLRQSGSSPAQADISPNSGGNQSTPATGVFLNVGGGSMLGPIAFFPKNGVAIVSGTVLDISAQSSGFSTYVTLGPSGGFTIKTIKGAINAGQLLILQGGGGGTITLDGTGGPGASNILPINGNLTYTWSGNDSILLIFDNLTNKWRQLTSATPIVTGANQSLSNLTNPTALNQDLNFGNHSITQLGTLQFQSSNPATPPFITTDNLNTFNISAHNYNISNLSNSVSSIPFIPNTGVFEVFASSHGNYGSPLTMRVASYKTVCDSTVLSANDPIGSIAFDGFSNTNVRRTWGLIVAKSVSNSNLTEQGLISFQVISNTNLTQIFTIDIGGAHFGAADFTGGIEIFGGAITLDDGTFINIGTSTGSKIGNSSTQKIGFWGKTPSIRQTVTGSRGGNAALQSLLSALNTIGIINDSSTP